MRFSTRCATAALIVGSLAAYLPAQTAEEAAANKLEAVRVSYEALQSARERLDPIMAKYRQAERGSDEQRELREQIMELRNAMREPQEAFRAAFAASDWRKLDPKGDAELLKEGLSATIRDLEQPQQAVEAGTFYLEHFGSDRLAESIRTRALPNALLACGEVEHASDLILAAIEEAEGPAKARLQLSLGDIRAAGGNTEEAAKLYAAAESNADERTMGYVTLRKELIGKPAPEIDSSEWIGGEAKPLSAMQGNVVLVDFWATWCGPCRAVMPALNEMYLEHEGNGLRVIGVTRYYENGYLPADESQMLSGGESVRPISEEDFPGHVTTFRDNTGIKYPFVIGEKKDFENYYVRGIPTLAVVDRDGKIALVTVGSGSEGLLQYAVGKLLADK